MKKRILSILAALSAVVITALCLTACGGTEYNFSERRDGYYTLKDSEYNIMAVSGEREVDFETDGVVTELIGYTLITVEPAAFNGADSYSYKVMLGNSEYSGQLVLHPFASSYSVELPEDAKNRDIKFAIIKNAAEPREYELKSAVTSDMLTVKNAISIANAALKDADTSGTELYARLVTGSPNICWYIRYSTADKTLSALIDSVTGEVMALRTA